MEIYKCARCSWGGPREQLNPVRERKSSGWFEQRCPKCNNLSFKGDKFYKEGWFAMSNDMEAKGNITHVRLENGRIFRYDKNWQKHRLLVTHYRIEPIL